MGGCRRVSYLRRERPIPNPSLEALHHLRRVEHAHQGVLPGVDLDPVVLILELNLLRRESENGEETKRRRKRKALTKKTAKNIQKCTPAYL